MKSLRRLRTLLVASLLCTFCFASSSLADEPAPQRPDATIIIPGPMRSFLRMAGISQKISPEEVVPLLAHNVFTQGYEGARDGGRPTEFLILLNRYVHQAKELTVLADPDGTIRIANCEQAKPLLRVLGYRVRQECGQSSTSLTTADPERAFLTIDSGFPLPELEETLQGGKAFSYAFPISRVPVIFTEKDWTILGNKNSGGDLIDTLLRDPLLCRLYWAISRTDAESRDALRQSVGLSKLLPLAATLDFYGTHICIPMAA